MTDEVLNQNQVEDLIRAMESENAAAAGTVAGGASAAKTAPAAPARQSPVEPRVRTMNYDFKRPERVGKELMSAMRALHEGLGRTFNASLSGLLRTLTDVKLVSADQLTYSEFVFSLDTPTCFCVMDVNPVEGNWVLDVAPSLAFSIIDRLLGGDPQPADVPKRPLTEIEHRLMGRVMELFNTSMKTTWENIVDLQPDLKSIESNPQLVQIVPPNEVIVLICFEVTMGKNRGMMNLCIPYNTIERFNSQLSQKSWGGYSTVPPTEESRLGIETQMDNAYVELTVTLARSKIKTGDLLGLDVGDLITTEHEVDKPLEVAIQRVPKFEASAGALKGKKAIRILEVVDLGKREAEKLAAKKE